jgi:hypothetical protein
MILTSERLLSDLVFRNYFFEVTKLDEYINKSCEFCSRSNLWLSLTRSFDETQVTLQKYINTVKKMTL